MPDGDKGVLQEFKTFLMKGDVIDLAVAVVIGLAFNAVVKALVTDILTPIVAAIFGKPDFAALSFTIHKSQFLYGDLINNIVNFVSIAAAIFFFVVKPVNMLTARRARPAVIATKECPECLSEIPLAAKRCAFCTALVSA